MTVSASDIQKLHRAIERYNTMARWVRRMRGAYRTNNGWVAHTTLIIGHSDTDPNASHLISYIEAMIKDDLDHYLDAALGAQQANICRYAEACGIPVDNIELEPADDSRQDQ